MCQFKKNITAIGLISLLAIPLFFAVVDILTQKNLQHTRKERFKTELIQTISITKENLHWVKKEKEVIIEGKYFDVKSYTINGNNVLLTGFYDHHEDKLAGHLKELMHQKKGAESPMNQLAVKYFFFPVYTQQSEVDLGQPWKFTTSTFFSYNEKIIETSTPVFSPPPEL